MDLDLNKLIKQYRLISSQISQSNLLEVLKQLKNALDNNLEGAVVELGCYEGTTSLFIERVLEGLDPIREFHVYDSFLGLPAKTKEDQSPIGELFKEGELKVSKTELIKQFKKAGLRVPKIHKAWFSDLTAKDMPKNIAFAFLDSDFYNSILTSLKLTWPRLNQGGIICVDDYKREALPGVNKAIEDYFYNIQVIKQVNNLAIIVKH